MRRTVRVRAFRVFSSRTDAVRRRRPTDVLLVVACVAVLLGLAPVATHQTTIDVSVEAIVEEMSGLLAWFWELCYALGAVWAVLLVLIVGVSKGRRAVLVDYALASLVAMSASLLVGRSAGTDWSTSARAFLRAGPPPVFLAVRVAVITAVVVMASPYLTRPLRYVGRGVVALCAASGVALGIAYLSGAVAGFAVGVASAAVVHLLRGSPGGLLAPEQVATALSDLGVDVDDVTYEPVQVAGESLLFARGTAGAELRVKVYGRDAWDVQLLGSLWTALTRRGESVRLASGRRARVEHEALVSLLAERAGVPVLSVVASGQALDGDALLVTEAPMGFFVDLPDDSVGPARLEEAWSTLARLHEQGTAHGRIDGRRLVVRRDGRLALGDFAVSRLAAASGDLMVDRARLLVTTALKVGVDQAVTSCVAVLGAQGLGQVLPYLQPACLDHQMRRALQGQTWKIDDLAAAAARVTGHDLPPLERVRRVTWKSLGKLAVIVFVVDSLVSLVIGVDSAQVGDTLKSANLWWLVAALMVSPMIQVVMSFSTLGATMTRMRYLPVLMLQYAIQFIALALPATAARLALEVRFFQRFGIAAGAALTMGMLDSFSGFVVQIGLIGLIMIGGVGGGTSTGGAHSSSGSAGDTSHLAMLVLALAVALIAVILTAILPGPRARAGAAITRFRATLAAESEAARSTLDVLHHPGKVGAMLGGNFGGQVLQAAVLGLCLVAFGQTAHLSQLILVNTAVSLFAGLMPVPGGVGVAEAGYTYGLEAIGVPSAIAFAVAITFRMVTFYLPPIWGWLSMRWLKRHAYV